MLLVFSLYDIVVYGSHCFYVLVEYLLADLVGYSKLTKSVIMFVCVGSVVTVVLDSLVYKKLNLVVVV